MIWVVFVSNSESNIERLATSLSIHEPRVMRRVVAVVHPELVEFARKFVPVAVNYLVPFSFAMAHNRGAEIAEEHGAEAIVFADDNTELLRPGGVSLLAADRSRIRTPVVVGDGAWLSVPIELWRKYGPFREGAEALGDLCPASEIASCLDVFIRAFPVERSFERSSKQWATA